MTVVRKIRRSVFKLVPAGIRLSIASFLVYQFYMKPKIRKNYTSKKWKIY